MSAPERRVDAAGGLVVDADGHLAVVHRPHRSDWSLPKGKLEAGESHRDAARREVAEETGLQVEVLGETATARYVDHRGRPKRVRYFVMTPVGGEFAPGEEVDRLEWLTPEQAIARLTYATDRSVVRRWQAAEGRPGQDDAAAGRGG